jgi:squalene-associated FAD-dependent desaturase
VSSLRIGVIGGGLAGIAGALAGADAGAQVVLLERRSSLGGLTTSIQRNGLSFDNGQHVFLRCCSAYREFIDRIGATDQVYLQPRLDVPVLSPGGIRATIKRNGLPAPFHLAGSLGRYRHLSVRERLLLTRAAWALRRLDPDDPSLDSISFGEWLTRKGQSPRAVDRLWDLIALPTLNVRAGEASLALATKVFRVGLLDQAGGADIGWSKVPLGELHGSIAARALDGAGVETVLNATVSSIDRTANGVFCVSVGESVRMFDEVIVATSPRQATALGALDADIGERLGTSPIVNIHFVLDRRVTDLALAACVDSPIQFIFDRTDTSGLHSGQCLVLSLSAADDYMREGSADLIATFFAALGDIFPLARGARVVDAVVTRERAATFRATPGSRSFRPSPPTSVPGLFLAGAWCETGWPATMEGAVRSGQLAVAEALAHAAGSPALRPPTLEGTRG